MAAQGSDAQSIGGGKFPSRFFSLSSNFNVTVPTLPDRHGVSISDTDKNLTFHSYQRLPHQLLTKTTYLLSFPSSSTNKDLRINKHALLCYSPVRGLDWLTGAAVNMAQQPSGPAHSVVGNFGSFYEAWLADQQVFIEQLLLAAALETNDKEERLSGLINQVLAHYQQYYEEISKAAGEDVFRVFSAPWLSSYERTLLWISGFKPSIIFRLLDGAVKDLSATQAARVKDVKADSRRKERELTEAVASLQESVAAPPILGLARRAGRLQDGEICEMDSAIEKLKMAMLGVFDRANVLRRSTLMQVLEILNPDQTVRLLAAAAEFQLRVRRWGVEKDSHGAIG